MANLVSAGVSVTVTDESFYISSGPGTVPLIILATQQDKPESSDSSVVNPDVAVGTLAKNAGNLWLMTSQQELLKTFGVPVFYENDLGAQAHGAPMNEYGLLAAYSYLGIANRAYVMRANIDLFELQPSEQPPRADLGPPTIPSPCWDGVTRPAHPAKFTGKLITFLKGHNPGHVGRDYDDEEWYIGHDQVTAYPLEEHQYTSYGSKRWYFEGWGYEGVHEDEAELLSTGERANLWYDALLVTGSTVTWYTGAGEGDDRGFRILDINDPFFEELDNGLKRLKIHMYTDPSDPHMPDGNDDAYHSEKVCDLRNLTPHNVEIAWVWPNVSAVLPIFAERDDGAWVSKPAPLLHSDEDADAYYGNRPYDGDVYWQYPPGRLVFTLKQFDGNTWKVVEDEDLEWEDYDWWTRPVTPFSEGIDVYPMQPDQTYYMPMHLSKGPQQYGLKYALGKPQQGIMAYRDVVVTEEAGCKYFSSEASLLLEDPATYKGQVAIVANGHQLEFWQPINDDGTWVWVFLDASAEYASSGNPIYYTDTNGERYSFTSGDRPVAPYLDAEHGFTMNADVIEYRQTAAGGQQLVGLSYGQGVGHYYTLPPVNLVSGDAIEMDIQSDYSNQDIAPFVSGTTPLIRLFHGELVEVHSSVSKVFVNGIEYQVGDVFDYKFMDAVGIHVHIRVEIGAPVVFDQISYAAIIARYAFRDLVVLSSTDPRYYPFTQLGSADDAEYMHELVSGKDATYTHSTVSRWSGYSWSHLGGGEWALPYSRAVYTIYTKTSKGNLQGHTLHQLDGDAMADAWYAQQGDKQVGSLYMRAEKTVARLTLMRWDGTAWKEVTDIEYVASVPQITAEANKSKNLNNKRNSFSEPTVDTRALPILQYEQLNETLWVELRGANYDPTEFSPAKYDEQKGIDDVLMVRTPTSGGDVWTHDLFYCDDVAKLTDGTYDPTTRPLYQVAQVNNKNGSMTLYVNLEVDAVNTWVKASQSAFEEAFSGNTVLVLTNTIGWEPNHPSAGSDYVFFAPQWRDRGLQCRIHYNCGGFWIPSNEQQPMFGQVVMSDGMATLTTVLKQHEAISLFSSDVHRFIAISPYTDEATYHFRWYDGLAWWDIPDSKLIFTDDGAPERVDTCNPRPIPATYTKSQRSYTVPDGALWHDSAIDKIDILVNNIEGEWEDFAGSIWTYNSDPIKDGQQVAVGDVWVDISDVENYPAIRVLDLYGDWELIDNGDSDRIVFGDARPDQYALLDADVPSTAGLALGVMLFNTRYSGMNIKKYMVDYVTDEGIDVGTRWVSVSGLAEDGSMLAGDAAVKSMVVGAMREAVLSSDEVRAPANYFNLIASPGYPEMMSTMQSLNIDKGEQSFVIGDSPFKLEPTGTALNNWATNANGAAEDGDAGLVTSGPYVGVWYPGGAFTSNIDGTNVVQPSSHIALHTIAYNDNVAYPWLAPAGLQRGAVTNASSVGHIDDEGEFVPSLMPHGMRDVAYVNRINPISVIPNRGLYVWGQKTLSPSASALDRINVARLVNYIRYQVEQGLYPYLFEPNDELTRKNAKDTVDGLLSELITLRGLYDYIVVCDESNNTPTRIDKNEMWVDIAIQPTKTVEFIYVPIRILNTGEDF